MTLHNYLLFVSASIFLVLVPGPDMLYLLGRCIAQGKKAGVMAALGFNLGGYAHLAAAVLGLSAVLATSALAFTVVKWLGAAYLIYLGISALCSKRHPISITNSGLNDRSARTIFWQAFVSDVLNPKVAMFFLALLPQFINSHAPHATLQILLLGLTLNMIALPANLVLVYCSARVTETLRQNDTIAAVLQKLMGVMFVALGLRIATEKI